MGLKLNIGALGPSIAEQLAAQGWRTSMPAATLDRYEHAIHLLRLHGLLTDAESDRAFKRLIKDLDAKRASGVTAARAPVAEVRSLMQLGKETTMICRLPAGGSLPAGTLLYADGVGEVPHG